MPASAAPVIGATGKCETHFDFAMQVTRIHEDPRVTKPYTEAQWQAVLDLGHQVDAELAARRAPDHGRRADLRLDRRHGRRGVELHRAVGQESANSPANCSAPARAASPPARCCISARASGIPASRCRAGRWAATGAPTASRCGRTDKWLVTTDGAGTRKAQDALHFIRRLTRELGLDPGFVIPPMKT
jgi:hypothetical protein